MAASRLEKVLARKIGPEIGRAAPGIKVQAFLRGETVCDIALGTTYALYDLASLTKVIFATAAAMTAYEEGLWSLDTRVHTLWPGFPAQDCRLSELLSHTSGAVWWHPFYQYLPMASPEAQRRTQLKAMIQALPWARPGPCIYSDVGMISAGFCLEALRGAPLLEIWNGVRARFQFKPSLTFHPGNRPLQDRTLYAPTEHCPWRGRRLQGEVHDENTWAFGGVSTHAGLFGGIDDVSGYGLLLRAVLNGTSAVLKPETVRLFTSQASPEAAVRWGFGFRLPAREAPSCGTLFSPDSFGHEGFTGTSLWFDTTRDLLVVILSNRVFYGRDRPDFRRLRPRIHDWIVSELA